VVVYMVRVERPGWVNCNILLFTRDEERTMKKNNTSLTIRNDW